MSRINEALSLKTDEERIAFLNSLTDADRDEIYNDVQKIVDGFAVAIAPVVNAFQKWAAMNAPLIEKLASMQGDRDTLTETFLDGREIKL